MALDRKRLAGLAPELDPGEIEQQLELLPRIAAGDRSAGEIALLTPSERFHWLTAPRSTVIQISAVHSGLTENPAEELDRLLRVMVLPAQG